MWSRDSQIVMARNFWKTVYLITVISWTITEGSKLNVPRVLLPLFSQLSTNFTLEVTEGGCYKWATSRPDVVSLSTLDVDQRLGCSSLAVVRAASAQDGGTALSGRATAIVLAEEVHSGLVLRCDVIVDVIHSLSIVTTTRELFVEEAPEAFEVRAYDDQGNEFSTLEGVAFEWSIGGQKREKASAGGGSSSEEAAGGSVLRFITYRDSPYEAPHGVELLESRGLRANTVLLEGMKTGSAKVSVRLPRQQGSAIRGGLPASVASAPSVPPVEVTLVVVANLLIDPPDIYVMPGCTIHYRVLQMKQGRLEEIPMPSEQYELELDQEGEGIAVIDYASSIVTAKKVGRTRVTLKDRYVDDAVQEGGASARGIPTAHLKVGLPASLSLSVLPHRNWALTLGNEYELSVEVLDVGGRRLMVPHDGPLHAATKVPAAIFRLSGSTKNGTWHWGRASALGTAPVTASIDVPKEWASTVAPARAEMRVFNPVKLIPSEVVLPCVGTVVEMQMRASGGDGNYVWTSSGGGGVVSLAQSGLLSVAPGECGLTFTAEVSVAMARNGHNRDAAKVWVLPVERLEITERVIEAEVGATVPLNVAIYSVSVSRGASREGVPFSDCRSLPFAVRVWDEEKFEQAEDSPPHEPLSNACNAIMMRSKMPGTTKVTVSSGQMDDTCIMVAYEPLKVVHPPSSIVVLAVGTSSVIQFEGGPRPLPGRPASEHVREIEFILPSEYDDDEVGYLVDATELGEESEIAGGIYTYHVLCRKLGEGELRLTVFNSPSGSLGTKSSATVTVVCSPPSSISLGIVPQRESVQLSLPRPCPIDPMAGRAVSHCLQDTNLEAVIMDPKGRKFDNVSSLVLEWQLSSYALGQLNEYGSSGLDTLRMLHPYGKTGALEVSCKIAEYRKSYFRSIGLTPPVVFLNGETQASITIVLVSEAVITPNHSVLFNHPGNGVALKISDGSGHFELLKSAFEFADTHLVTESPKGGGLVKISPKSPGTFHLSVVDLCLPGMAPASAEVQIFGIASIEAEVPDKVELGRSINASVRLIDTLGRTMPSPLPDPRRILGFKSIPASDLIGVAPAVMEKIEKGVEGSLNFTVSGLALGDTTLTFSVSNPGTQAVSVVSAPMPIQVFPPLRLHPRSLVLVPGSVFQINYSGGPHPDPGIEFRMGGEFGSSSVAAVGKMGLVEALAVGSASVWARATLAPPTASQESVEVRVVSLVGIRVKVPILRLCSGCTMPAWAEGVGQGGRGRPVQVSPLILGSVRPGPEFSWNVAPHDTLSIHGVFSAMDIEGREADRVSVRLHGLRPGRATVHLRVSLPALPSLWTAGGILEDSLEVEVFEEITLLLPPPPPLGADHRFGRPLLMAPGATLNLRTNKENVDGASVSYELMPGAKESSVIKLGPGGVVSSSNEFGKSVVMATYTEPSGSQQSIVIAIEVKPIHYMMLTLRGSGGDGESAREVGARDGLLPRGLPLNLRISYHDDTGAMFSAAKRNLRFRTNRADLMQISHGDGNDTLVLDTIESGETMLKVWGEGGGASVEKEGESQLLVVPTVMDYVKLHVGEVILPAKPVLTVGDVICFQATASIPQSPSGARRGHGPWTVVPLSGVGGRSVSEGDVLKLDEHSGIGRAVGPGQALVRLQLTASGGTTSTEVDVHPINSIVFLSSGGPGNLTNSHPEIPFKVPLVLLGPDDSALAKRSNVIPSPLEVWDKEGSGESPCGIDVNSLRPFPFRCILQFSEQSHVPLGLQVGDIFSVRSGFDPVKGVYVCEVIPHSGSTSVEIATLQVNFILRVVAMSSYKSLGAVAHAEHGVGAGSSLQVSPTSLTTSQPLLLPFYPAVIVQPLSIQLSSGRPAASLTLTGSPSVLEQVEIQVCDESVLLVEGAPSSITSSTGLNLASSSSSYSIHLKKAYWSSNELTRPLFITVISEFTQQRIEVPVKVRLSEGDGIDVMVQAPCIAAHINSAGFSLVDFIFAYRNSFILIISTIVLVLVSLYAYTTYIEPMVARQRPVTLTYSPRQSPTGHSSPQMPQSPLLRLSPGNVNESTYGHRHGSPYSEVSEPVYGAVGSTYYQSPSLRRNRKFL